MSNVVHVCDVLTRKLAEELGISPDVVDACAAVGIRADQGKALLRWFLQASGAASCPDLKLSPELTANVTRGILATAERARSRTLATTSPPVVTPLPVDVDRECAPLPSIFQRSNFYASVAAAHTSAQSSGVVALNPAAYVGLLLLTSDGDVTKALASLPVVGSAGDGPYTDTVREYLTKLAKEEGSQP